MENRQGTKSNQVRTGTKIVTTPNDDSGYGN